MAKSLLRLTVQSQEGGGGGALPIEATFDGGGAIADIGLQKFYRVDQAKTIKAWYLFSDTPATVTIDIWRITAAEEWPPTVADTICNGHLPALNDAQEASDSDLSDWTSVELAAGDKLIINLSSNDLATKIYLQF